MLEVESHGTLSEREVREVMEEWEGQCKDGFGEGFSQREIRIREGLLHVHFCSSLWNFKIQTEQELKGEVEEAYKMQLGSLR